MDDDGADGYDAADGQRACVTHEHLGGICVVPQEAYQRTYEGAHEDYQFLAVGNIHYIKVRGKLYMRAHISEDAKGYANDGRVAGTHAVHAIVEVGSVAYCRDNEYGHDDEQYPSGRCLVLTAEAHDAGVVEVVPLYEGDGCLKRFLRNRAMGNDGLLTLLLYGQVLVHLDIGRCPQHQSHYESYANLSYNLVLALQSFLVTSENLYEVVHAAKKSQPYRCHNHQYEVDVAQTAQKEHGHQYRHDDDDTAH